MINDDYIHICGPCNKCIPWCILSKGDVNIGKPNSEHPLANKTSTQMAPAISFFEKLR